MHVRVPQLVESMSLDICHNYSAYIFVTLVVTNIFIGLFLSEIEELEDRLAEEALLTKWREQHHNFARYRDRYSLCHAFVSHGKYNLRGSSLWVVPKLCNFSRPRGRSSANVIFFFSF